MLFFVFNFKLIFFLLLLLLKRNFTFFTSMINDEGFLNFNEIYNKYEIFSLFFALFLFYISRRISWFSYLKKNYRKYAYLSDRVNFSKNATSTQYLCYS